jgi:hypothetical protein
MKKIYSHKYGKGAFGVKKSVVKKSRGHKCLMFTFSDGIQNVNVISFRFTFMIGFWGCNVLCDFKFIRIKNES